MQALAGDSTDNVPGAPGIGIKTAAQLITEYGDLETLLKRTTEIKQPKRRESLEQNAELIRISRQLVLLKDDVPVPVDPDSTLIPAMKAGALFCATLRMARSRLCMAGHSPSMRALFPLGAGVASCARDAMPHA